MSWVLVANSSFHSKVPDKTNRRNKPGGNLANQLLVAGSHLRRIAEDRTRREILIYF